VFAALSLVACSGKTSAVATREPGSSASAPVASSDYGQARAQDPRDLPVPRIDGKPLWAANRKHTAEENAEYQFTRNGGDFGAASETAYVSKAHAFIEHPPSDVETIDRPNGDKLMYDAKGNTFAVVSRDGAPRTMFKPRGGAAYWTQQKDQESNRPKSGQDGGGSDQG
jgi:pyocin large subunit-like protein